MIEQTEAIKIHSFSNTAGFRHRRASRQAWLTALCLLFLQFLPTLLLWDEAYIRIHDTLEGIDYQFLFNSGKIFDYSPGATIEQVLNGQLRAAVKTGWSGVALWQGLFGFYVGYIINYVLIHLTAFFGIYLLLRHHLLPGRRHEIVRLGAALCFSWVPFFSMLGLTAAGQPLVAWAFLNILKMRRGSGNLISRLDTTPQSVESQQFAPVRQSFETKDLLSWLVLSLFPFYSDIVWAGLPILLVATGYGLRQFWKSGRLHFPYFVAIGWLGLLYVAANWQLFELTFLPGDFVSHRAEYDYFYNKHLTLRHSLKETLQVFFISHHHAGIFASLPIFLATIWMQRRFGHTSKTGGIFSTILAISLFYGFYNWLVWLGDEHFVLLKSFKFERVIILLPALWLALFALSLARLEEKTGDWLKKNTRLTAVQSLLAAQFFLCVLANDEFAHNLRQLAGQLHKPNFQAFFDEKLFAEIDRHIGLPKETYRVISLGMHPSVAQFNGFFTLDCHASLYDLRYKHQFRKIMESELAKNETIRTEFDHFGNRCYLYSAELGKEYDAFLCGKTNAQQVKNLDLDADALCGMGGCYLFSAVEILNAEETGLRLKKVFEGQFWRVHLYEVVGKKQAQFHENQ